MVDLTDPCLTRTATSNGSRGLRAIIHIGVNKTGSTSVQHWLSENEAALRQQGIYPARQESTDGRCLKMIHGIVMLVRSRRQPAWLPQEHVLKHYGIGDREELDRLVDDFERRFDDSLPAESGTYVVSSEYISEQLLSPPDVRDLDAWLRARFTQVEYVVYMRDQVDWVPSCYGEIVKCGRSILSLDAFIAQHGRYNYHGLVRRWAGSVGRDRFHVRLFDPDAMVNGDIIDDFAALLGANVRATRRPPRMNPGLSRRQLAAMRVANRISNVSKRLRLPDVGFRIRTMVFRLPTREKLRLSLTQAAQVARLNADDNEALRAWLFPSRPVLFGTKAAPVSRSIASTRALPDGRRRAPDQPGTVEQ